MPNRILLVEDEPIVAGSAQFLLCRSGLRNVTIAPRNCDAISQIERGGIDLAIVDYRLGEETAEPVIDMLGLAEIPYVALSANCEAFDSVTSHRPVSVLVKPYAPRCFVAAVGDALNLIRPTQLDTTKIAQDQTAEVDEFSADFERIMSHHARASL